MKKILSILLLCAMLLSTAAVFAVGGTAAENGNTERTAAYVSHVTVDGDMDAAWENTVAYRFAGAGEYRMMWNETGMYFLFSVAKSDVNDSKDASTHIDNDTAHDTSSNKFRFYYAETGANGIASTEVETTVKKKTAGCYDTWLFPKPQADGKYGKSVHTTTTDFEALTGTQINSKWHEDKQVRIMEIFIPLATAGVFGDTASPCYMAFRWLNGTDNWSGLKASSPAPYTQAWQDMIYKVHRLAKVEKPVISYEPGQNGNTDFRTAAYAGTSPVVDGVKDAIWDTTVEYTLGGLGSGYRMLWNESGMFFLYKITRKDVNTGANASTLIDNETAHGNDDNRLRFFYNESDQNGSANTYPGTGAGAGYGAWLTTKPKADGTYITSPDSNNDLTFANLEGYEINSAWNEDEDVRYVEIFLPVSEEGAFDMPGYSFFYTSWRSNKKDYYSGCKDTDNEYWTKDWQTLSYKVMRVKGDINLRGAQQTAPADGKCDVRFIADIANIDNYKETGFEVQVSYSGGAGTTTVRTNEVYESILAGNDAVTPNRQDGYLVALKISGIPAADETVTFTVTPYAIDKEGNTHKGVTGYNFVLTNGVLKPVM